jgi:hypothetical protein
MATNPSFDDLAVMPLALFRKRAPMSKTEFFRRRQRQLAGEPGSELLLPKLTQLSAHRYGVRFDHEREWKEANTISFVAPSKRQRARAST